MLDEEAPEPERCPDCGAWPDDYAGAADCPDGFMLCCSNAHQWRAALSGAPSGVLKRMRLTALAHKLGTTLDYVDQRVYPGFVRQVAKFRQLVAPTKSLETQPELTGSEIETMREFMENRGEAARDEADAVNAVEAAIKDEGTP
jgi:hypothetical protein